MSSINATSSSGSLWDSFSSLFDNTSEQVKTDVNNAVSSAKTQLETAQEQVTSQAQTVEDDSWSLGKLIDELI